MGDGSKKKMGDRYEIPRCMIASCSSGSGKTMITLGLIGALKKRGFDTIPFKCGPDYIDPMYLSAASGRQAVNLDTFLAGDEGVKSLLAGYASAACTDGGKTCAVIEGVMGIYDGTSPSSLSGSAYEIAAITDTPVILLVDAAGVGRTVISLIKGILSDDDKGLIKGLILNRMSDAFYDRLRPSLADELAGTGREVRILGNIPKAARADTESRHLGLKMPHESADTARKIEVFTSLVEKCCDMDLICDLMGRAQAVACSDEEESGFSSSLKGGGDEKLPLLAAVARDEAFCFYYRENIRMLEQLGVKMVPFSPVHDKKLPEGISALLLGGGYPELYIGQLSLNTSMNSCVREAIEGGMPVIAECGGFMYLHREVEDLKGNSYAMAGVIDGKCTYTGHLVNFGYAVIEECAGYEYLEGMRGHEFHYYDSTCPGSDAVFLRPSTGKRYRAMMVREGRWWGFGHMYYPSAPEAVRHFVRKMREYEKQHDFFCKQGL